MSAVYKETELGEIPIDWDFVEFSSIAELRHGYQFRNYDFTESGIKILKITQIKGNETIDLSSCSFISEERIDDFRRVIIEKGDILIALTGATIGKIARFNSDELVLQNYRVGNFFPLDENNLSKDYLFHYLRSNFFYHQILARQTQSAQQNIGKEEINNMMVFLPKPEEQKAIANILTAFDDKIENLQAQNKTLEQTAQTIFAAWFGKYQVGDELPDGWRITQLRELAKKISKGTTPRKKDVEGLDGIISFLKVRDISDGGLINKDSLELIPKEVHNKQLKRSILKHNDILFSIAGTIGRVAIVDNELENSNCNQALAFIRLNEVGKFKEYVHLWLKSNDVQNKITNSIVQGVQANVSLTVLGDLKITIPDDSKLKEWKSLISPIYSKLDNNNSQIQTLKKTRDTLLPKLMSGQIRVNGFK